MPNDQGIKGRETKVSDPYQSQHQDSPVQGAEEQSWTTPDATYNPQNPYTPMSNQTPIQPWQRQAQYVYGPGMSDKSKVTAAIYAFFLGEFGIHNFYLGRTGRGVAQLLITLFLAIIVIGPIISWVWAIVEGAQILGSHPGSPYHTDGNGLQLQD